MISTTIINHDTKNIYESDLADKTWTRLAFLSTALHNVVGEEADWNSTDALHMFGLHVRWLVARLRHAPPELASKHAMQPHRLEQVKQANSSRSTNMLTDVVRRAYIIYATEGMPHQISKSPSRDSTFIKAYMTNASVQPRSPFHWESVMRHVPHFKFSERSVSKNFWPPLLCAPLEKWV